MRVEENPQQEELELIGSSLSESNRSLAGMKESQSLYIILRDENNLIVGGLTGSTSWQWLHVKLLWVSEAIRHHGYGSALLSAAEQEALRRGCKAAYLNTFSFQAPDFYQKQGYVIFGELPDYPPGHNRYFLRKEL